MGEFSDEIHIRDLMVRCIIGVFPHERQEKQEVIFNIILYTDMRRASASDDLTDTVNYKQVKKNILAMVEDSEYQLIEALAERTAQICLAVPGVQRVRVELDKPGALRFARSVAVAIVRDRPGE
jgi:dihydroneopterin aldolase/D-erythro-7,8-dihydroneopterin triphosphate epimerase